MISKVITSDLKINSEIKKEKTDSDKNIYMVNKFSVFNHFQNTKLTRNPNSAVLKNYSSFK